MLKAIMEAAKKGDMEGLEAHVLAVLAENASLHQTIQEQVQTLERNILSLRASMGGM